jgi:phage head maturation protease
VNLLDVGPVTYPAYQSTTTGLRSDECDDALEAFGKWQNEQWKRNADYAWQKAKLDMESELA